MSLAPGSSIGPYKILAAIGAGGMGEVYRARDTRLKRDVALKILPEMFAADPGRLARFTREAEVLASLNHPNIATIFGVEDGALVMELVEGEPPHGPMSFDAAWKILSQIAMALEYAHEKGVIHRDLKPANVKITADGVVKLLDFGLAKALTEDVPHSSNPEQSPTLTLGATEVGMIIGTAGYMSPEQAKGKTVDRRADIWAFGVMSYELLTGKPLFQAEDVVETLAQVLTREPDLSRTPARAQKLLRRCLEKDPRRRLKDIGEAQHLIDEPAVAPPSTRRPFLPWAIAAAAILFAAAAWWLRKPPENSVIRSFILAPELSAYRCQGDDAGPAVLSPDGKRLAFSARREGKVMLWVRALDSVSPQPIAGTEDAMFPFWSPDGRRLAFFSNGKLKKIELATSILTVIADAPITRGGAWNRDDVILFSPTFTSPLMRVPASGGAVTPATRLDDKRKEISHRWPSFLPDHKHFLYTSRDQGVFVGSLDAGEAPRRLLEEKSNAVYRAGFLLYAHGTSLVARPFDAERREFKGAAIILAQAIQAEPLSDRACFTASENGLLAYHGAPGESQMTWFDRAGNRLGKVSGPASLQGVEIAPDGQRVAAVISDGADGRTVWIYELARGIRTRFGSASSIYLGMAWSHDSKRLATVIQKDGAYRIYTKVVGESGGENLLYQSAFELSLSQWLSDGRLIIGTRSPKTGFDVAYLPPPIQGRDSMPVPVVHEEPEEVGGVVSPDGQWILYGSDESAGGLYDLFVAAFPSGSHPRQVSGSDAHSLYARWNPNGKEIFFVSRNRVMAVSVRSSAGTLEVENPRALFEIGQNCDNLELTCFDVSPDGKRFLVVDTTGPPPSVALVQNWTAGLSK